MKHLPMHNRYRVKLGNFTLGWIVETELTVRYFSMLCALAYVESVEEAIEHFRNNIPESARKDLVKELMSNDEAR